MNSENKTQYIKQLLSSSTTQLSPETLEKLRMARTNALNNQRTRTSPVLAWVDHYGNHFHAFNFSKSANLALSLLFIASLFIGIYFWHSYSKEREMIDVDIAILTDDLPINVYLD